MRNQKIAARIFCELRRMNDNGETPIRVQSYSGRAMYGRKCVGLVGDYMGDILGGLTRAARFVSESEDFTASEVLDVLYETLHHISMDNMGLGMVIYAPNMSADLLDNDEDDED